MRFALAILIIGFFPIFLLMSLSVKAKPTINSPVVVELFTSQSCSSCPPADKVLGDLAQSADIIALSCHVTYWNHLHWKDTLSRSFCTDRQRSYVQAMRKRTSYTPQMVINGRHDVVGSRRGQVIDTVEKSSTKQEIAPLMLTHEDGRLNIRLPALSKGSYTLTLLPYGGQHTQSIPSGENRGRTVTYTNPVTGIIDLGTWDGTARILSHDIRNSSGYAALVHKNHAHGEIVAAGKI